jgi:hypothetical protein
MIGDSHVIPHNIEKGGLPQITVILGEKVEIKSFNWRIGVIVEEMERRER